MEVAVATRAGRPAWINRRTVCGVALVALSMGGGHLVLESGKTTTPVWVATRDLAGGSPLTPESLRIEHVRLPPVLASEYVPSEQPMAGNVVTRPVSAGELLHHEWLAPHAPGRGRAVTIPVDPEHALGGALEPGDLVDIFATFNSGDVRARTVPLVRSVEVLGVVSSGGLVMGDRSVVGITISVNPEDAQRVAFATRTAELDVARVEDPSQQGRAGIVRSEDF